ncbi:MAG: SIMPL domain-containing protein [Bermanella sp.]
MIKNLWLLLLVVSLSACMEKAALQTQASAQSEIQANEYQVFVNFKQQDKDQESLMLKLEEKTSKFVSWSQQQFTHEQLVGEDMRLQPVYEYPKHQARQLVSYEVSQKFRLTNLTFEQYNLLMQQLATFKAESFGLQSVQASQKALNNSRVKLVEEAFVKNKAKAEHLAGLSNLCELRVADIKEYDQGGSQPRMMSMRAKSDSNAPSKQSQNVRIEVTWWAKPC